MRIIHTVLTGALFASLAGCGLAMRPVALEATPATWEALAGDWRGEYTMTGHDRHGLIMIRLKAAEHEAFGDVLMIPDRFAWPYDAMPAKEVPPGRHAQSEAQLLTLRFVSADRGLLHGTMDAYWDPDRQCQAWASFLGSIDGDVIAGSFISVCEDDARTFKGHWRVERRRR